MAINLIHPSAFWTATNPILERGMFGKESDTLLRKTGNGLTAWNDLKYDTPIKNSFEQILSGDTKYVPSSFAVKEYVDLTG